MSEKIENLLGENRTFDPPSSIVENANATKEWFDLAEQDRLAYWQKQALERITWYKEPTEILDDSNAPFYQRFKSILQLSRSSFRNRWRQSCILLGGRTWRHSRDYLSRSL